MTGLVWFRQDLRIADNPALFDAVKKCEAVLCLFILEDMDASVRKRGRASRWWLHHCLQSLSSSLESRGNRLLFRAGNAEKIVAQMVETFGITDVFWNDCYEPWRVQRDKRLQETLVQNGTEVHTHTGALLYNPSDIMKSNGKPYSTFAQFWKTALSSKNPDPPLPAPQMIPAPTILPESAQNLLDEEKNAILKTVSTEETLPTESLNDWKLLVDTADLSENFNSMWQPGEQGAIDRLNLFLDTGLQSYAKSRDIPAKRAVSRLSPHLNIGDISPRQVWDRVKKRMPLGLKKSCKNEVKFLAEIGWREFSYYLLYHFPDFHTEDHKHFTVEWHENPEFLAAWQAGQTGIPIVDAGMRHLAHIGWIPHRVRVIVASFLVKNLRQNWRHGEAYFWDMLVDADMANNLSSWLRIACCGIDPTSYFGVMNPVYHGKKIDPYGHYIRKYVPELENVPAKYIHEPWTAKDRDMIRLGITLGETYPYPLVDITETHNQALEVFGSRTRSLRAAS